ncbi:MAG: ABC transporter permease [Pseudomonadota bacterium]
MLERITLERRAGAGPVRQTAAYTGSLVTAIALSLGVLVAAGVPIRALYQELVVQVFLAPTGQAQTLTAATPMLLVGLSAALCLRLKFWNIGLEGQLLLGGIFATGVALTDLGGPVRLALMLIASAIGGALWIAAPLLLRLRLGVSEVIVTLMMTNIAYLLLQHLLFGAFGDPTYNFPSSPAFDDAERLPRLGFGSVHLGLVIALAAVAAVAWISYRTPFGFASRFAGHNPEAARTVGFNTTWIIVVSVLAAGALSGLAGGIIVAGTEFRLSQQIGLHATFNGIVIAALARNEPLWIVPVSLLIAGLTVASASLKVFYGVSEGVVLIIQGIILFCLVAGQFLTTYRVSLTPMEAVR